MNDPAVVRRYLNFFDEVWQTSMQESQMRQMPCSPFGAGFCARI
jgi:hypothetical protein